MSLDNVALKSKTDSSTEDDTEDVKEAQKRGLYMGSWIAASKRQKID